MRMRIAVLVAAFGVASSGIAAGQDVDSPIPARQELMKMNGAAAKAASEMIKGNKPYDAAEAADAMKIIQRNTSEFPGLFPEGSEQGGDTEASPKIWEDMEGFKAEVEELVNDARAAEAAAAEGLDAFKTAFAKVGDDCSSCHETFRLSKN